MNMIKNYLDDFKKYLPDDIKQEVSDELESSIYEQLEDKEAQLNRKLTESEIEYILKKIGHPMRIAAAYLPGQQLIGKELFPAYKKSLEISLVVILGIVLLVSLPLVFSSGHIIVSAISIISDIINSGLYVFAIVTIVFYLMEHYQTDLNEIYAWSPKQLKSRSPSIKFSRLESGFELIFLILFLCWWNDFLNWPSIISHEGIISSIHFSPEWLSVSNATNTIVGLNILVSFHKFLTASWSKFSLVSEILLAIAALIVIYNITQFDQFVVYNELINNTGNWKIASYAVNNIVYSILGMATLISFWEIFSNTRKLIRD